MKFKPDYKSQFRILKGGKISLVVSALLGSVTLSFAAPTGGVITSGSATISQNANTTNIQQSTQKATINWQGFSINSNETVNFNQPNVNAITLNRVVGNERSIIDGALNANGQVWILNSNGILFNQNAKINTAGIIATTKNISDADFNAGNYKFSGESTASVINMGTIETSDSGYVALLANTVQNDGTIKAYKGTVHLIGASEATINLNGNSIVNLTVNKGVLDALVENKGAIMADGGKIYLTTNAVDELLKGVVNNTGVIEAKSLKDMNSEVILFAHGGTANIAGEIKANGGFVETSGKELGIKNGTTIKAKTWLIDPVNVTIDSSADAIGGATVGASVIETALSTGGGNTNVIITADNDITVNEALAWSANKLTLSAGNNIAINADMTATGTGSLAFEYGQGTANGSTSRYTVAEGIDIKIPSANAFTWKKGSGGTTNNLVLNNNKIRFGDGTEESLTQEGTLKQPWYYDEPRSDSYNHDDWFPLTYDESSGYPLDIQIAVGGDGSTTWNENGTLYNTDENTYIPVTSSLNISKYYEGYGTIVSTVTLDASTQVKNTYTLTQNDMYLKTVTEITNLDTTNNLTNLRVWVGTRDDYIATNDDPSKTKGNLTSNGFEAITAQNQQAKALKITENEDGTGAAVLFYSTSANADVAFEDCCSFSNVTGIDPRTSNIYIDQDDGSYAMFMRMNDLTPGQSQSMNWYYAAGPVSELNSIVNQVSSSAGVSNTPSVSTPSTSTPTVSTPTTSTLIATTPTPTTTTVKPAPVAPVVTENQQVNKVIDTIVNQQQVKVELPKILVTQPTIMTPVFAPKSTFVLPPAAPSSQGVTMLSSISQTLGLKQGESVSLVSSPNQEEATQKVTMGEIQVLMGSNNGESNNNQNNGNAPVVETRVSLGGGSIIDLVNGGVNLPEGVDQEFYVVKTNQASN